MVSLYLRPILGMRQVNNITITVFSKVGEDREKIISRLKELVPLNPDEEKISVVTEKATAADESPIYIMRITLSKERHASAFLDLLKQKLSAEQKSTIIRQLHSRLDDEMDFYIRFEKDALLNENSFQLTDGGNCFHIRMNIASFPKKHSVAEKVIKEIFQ